MTDVSDHGAESAGNFVALMEAIWEGGAAYDLHFPAGVAHNANDMLRALFPAVADGIKHPHGEPDSDEFGYWYLMPDRSQVFIQANGDGCHFVDAPDIEED